MNNMETWIFILVIKSFVNVNGVEHACTLDGSDFRLFGDYDEACEAKATLQEEFYKKGYHLEDSGCTSSDPSLCYWSRIERSDGFARVLAIYKKSVMGELIQFRHY